MTDVIRTRVGSNVSASTDYTLTFDATGANTPLDSSHGIVAYVKRTAADPAPTAIDARFEEVPGTAGTTGGTTKTFTSFYKARGNGVINDFNVKGLAAQTQVFLWGVANVNFADWFKAPVQVVSAATAGPLSASFTGLPASTTVIGVLSVGGTFGDTPIWTGLTRNSGGSTSGSSWASTELTAAGNLTVSVDWLNSDVSRLTLLAMNVPATSSVTVNRNGRLEHVEDFSDSVGIASISAVSQTAGPAVTVTISGLVARYVEPENRTDSITLNFTLTETGGATRTSTVTIPPIAGGGDGYEEMVYQGGVWV